MPGSWPDPEAVAAEAGRQDETGNALNLTDGRDAIGRTVDIAGPCVGNGDASEVRDQLAGTLIGEIDLTHVRSRIEYPVPFHRCHLVRRPFGKRLVALPPALEAAEPQTAPATGKHRHEFS